jgi:hypothetical protein
MKLLDQAGLTQARLSDDEHRLTVNMPRAIPAPREHGYFFLAADKRH